ncbi:hypothetical protein DFH06DRAFT_289645 [Mycena polygramma]|nr:hypothetical protein DFH06DRAFT_289645 [Mycena polygramma]
MTTTTTALRKRLLELDAQIGQQKIVLSELERARGAAERELHATATFPILTLPVEITAEIFVHSLPAVDDDLSEVCCSRTVPFNISCVCRAWRDIAVTTPQLWSTLRVSFDSIPSQIASERDIVKDFIDRWLTRAGTCPLSLILDTAQFSLDPLRDTTRHLRDTIRRYSNRVEYLHIYMMHGIGELELNSTAFPVLQRATLNYLDYIAPNLPNDILSNAPRFHDLYCESGISPSRITFPWLQLTKFAGTIWNLELFTVAPNLIEVQCWLDPDETSVLTAVTHPRIRSLTMKDRCSGLIRYLSLPALKYLDVLEMDPYDYGSLGPFLKRSSPPLESLSVRADHRCYPKWHRCLPRIAGTLKNLHVSHVPRDVMSSMFPVGHEPTLDSDCLRDLRALSFEDVDGGVDLHWLTEFLYSRSDKLRSFRLIWKDNPFLDGKYLAGPLNNKTSDTIGGHLLRINRAGTEIYLGTKDKNYAAI